jgi:carbon-monoxide dehydrogenase large subunit
MTMTRVIGASPQRADGIEKVTGAAQFVADMQPARTEHARVFRSTQAHARIRKLDVSRAQAAPGVRAVITGQNVTGRIGHAIQDQFPLAVDKVRFWGEPVAVVVASTVEQAENALALIDVEYEPLPSVLHPKDAVAPDAPLIHEALGDYHRIPQVHSEPGSNIAHHYRLRKGDVDNAFAQAAHVFENEFWVPWIAHVAMEPHGAVAEWDGQDLSIWTSSQSPFFVRDTISEMLRLSPAHVRVVIPYVGGGFGGKSDVTIEPLLALVAYHVPHRAVSLMLTREETFFGAAVGRGCWGRLKTALDADGYLVAHQTELYFGAGGYADYCVWICQGGGHNSTGPYSIPNIKIDSHAVYTNTPPTGAYRGYGHPEAHWMMERQMDIIARRLQLDPIAFRLKNLLTPGKENAIGQTLKPYNGRADLCLTSVKEALGEKGQPSGPMKARGQAVTSFMKSPVMRTNAQSGAILRFNEDGSVNLWTGAVEIGQGTTTVMSQIAAETLGIPVERVHYTAQVDTSYSPHEWQTVASHTTWAVGNAVRAAAEDALAQIRAAAAQYFKVEEASVLFQGDQVYPAGHMEEAISFQAIGLGMTLPNGSAVNPPIIGRGTFVPQGLTNADPDTGKGNLAASWTFGSQGAEIEIDLNTGQVHVLHFVTALDAGRILNPANARGQVEGAVVQALGATFMEKLQFGPDGRIRNPSFVDYRIPTTVDIPDKMETLFVETPDAVGPYGARGLGEHGIVAVPAAIANAIADALGIEIYEIPITPQMILDELEKRSASEGGAPSL